MNKQPIILGGGLAGLSACYHGKGIIYEQNETVGGHAKSHTYDGFTFDEGIHVLHTKNEYVLDLLKKTGANLDVRKREAWIVSHGVLTRYPFQANTYGLPTNIVKDCLLGFIENDFNDRVKVMNYEDWLYFMFGKGIAEHFMISYSQKFWGTHPRELTTDWVDIRHPRPSLEEVIDGALHDQKKSFGVNAEFRYPKKGGFGAIAQSLARICKDRIKCGMKVTNIDVQRKEIEFNNSSLVQYKDIISTIPLPDLLALISDAPHEVRGAVKKLRTNSIFVVNIGINRPNISDKHWIYFLEKEFSFFRISFPVNKSNSMVPKGTSSISAEIAYGNDNVLPVNKDEISIRVINDLKETGIILKDDEITFTDTIDIKYGYVIYDKKRKDAVNIIHKYLRNKNIFPCGRYGDWAYYWSDDAILSGKKAAKEVNGIS
jgi:UDP-galactopyranose mutase